MTAKKTPVTPVEEVKDSEAIVTEPGVITLTSGSVIRVERLKTRGLFKLLKIVTRGAGPIIMQMPLDFDDNEAFVQQLLAVIVMAVPEAENEAIEFIQSIALPADYIEHPQTKAQIQENENLIKRLMEELDDPEIEDTISIIEGIVVNEAGNIQALGKRLGSILRTQRGSASAVAKN